MDKETKDQQTMWKLITARQMILVTDVTEDGLPRPGTTFQKMREWYADKFLFDLVESQTENMRRHTKDSFTLGRATIFAGKDDAHDTDGSVRQNEEMQIDFISLPSPRLGAGRGIHKS